MFLGNRIRFSLRSLLAIMLIAAALAGYFRLAYMDHYREEGSHRDQVKASGGRIYEMPREPAWLWSQFGDQIGKKGTSVNLSDTNAGDKELAEVCQLTELGGLTLNRTKITDAGLKHLEKLTELVQLNLRRTSIENWPPVLKMSRLVALDLSFTKIQDIETAGLVSLETLELRATLISDRTLANFGELPSLERLDIAGTPGMPMQISDSGISQLSRDKLPKLQQIFLYFTDVTEEGIAHLKTEFPGLVITR